MNRLGSHWGLTVYYDGWCPMCQSIRSRLEHFDWLHQLRFRSIRETGVAEEVKVPQELLERRMVVRFAHHGNLADGIWAVAAVAARVPLLMPLWPIFTGAALVGLGQPVYDWVARRRLITPVGQCSEQDCPIGPGTPQRTE